jgi:hypothetical protein
MRRGTKRPKPAIGRSPAYPFIPLERAIARASQLWRAVARSDVDVASARQHWGFGPRSSGGIQTEAALKQFGLLEVSGRGIARRLKLSELAVRLVGDAGLDVSERRTLTQRAGLNPRIHRELWDRWGDVPPGPELRRYLTKEQDPPFKEKGVVALSAEYQKTVLYMGLVGAGPGRQQAKQGPAAAGGSEGTRPEAPPRSSDYPEKESLQDPASMKENEIKVILEHNHLRVSAFVDRDGLKKLLKILEANRPFLEGATSE